MLVARIDRYLLGLTLGKLGGVVGILMSLMVLEHIPRLIEITRLSGHRGYIVGQTLLGLLPEYAGIGVVIGIYLALGMAIRTLALRGELSVIEASGIAPVRWMRMPIILTVLGALFVFVNQGWLMPFGERRLEDIGQRMEIGDFGVNLAAGEFIDLGGGATLHYAGVDEETGALQGLFLTDADRTFSASSGLLSIAPDGAGVVQLVNGQAIDREPEGVMTFRNLAFRERVARTPEKGGAKTGYQRRMETLDRLLSSDDPGSHSAAYSRLLWSVLVLASGALAFILARPPIRSSSAIGLASGLGLLVGFLKSITLLELANFPDPAMAAVSIGAIWLAVIGLLAAWHQKRGYGAIDQAALSLVRQVARRSDRWFKRAGAPA